MNNQNPIEIYQAQDGTTQVEVRFENDTVCGVVIIFA